MFLESSLSLGFVCCREYRMGSSRYWMSKLSLLVASLFQSSSFDRTTCAVSAVVFLNSFMLIFFPVIIVWCCVNVCECCARSVLRIV